MEFLRRHLKRRISERRRQRPDIPAAGEAPIIREKKSPADLLKERIPQLSVVPPEEQWGTIRVKKEGQYTPTKIPFVESEVDAIGEAFDSCIQLWAKGALNSGCERDFWNRSLLFPRPSDAPNSAVPTLDDRPRAVKGIVLSAIAAREILDMYPQGNAFAPRENSLVNLERIASLPDQLLAHEEELPTLDVPKVIFEKDQ